MNPVTHITKIKNIFAAIAAAAALLFFVGGIHAHDVQTVSLESYVEKTAYAVGDTVIVGIRAAIPRGYHLYSNPLGPGIGKPLALYVDGDDMNVGANAANENIANINIANINITTNTNVITNTNIIWTSARKSAPRRYRPPVGDWVWAYQTEAYFFLQGVVTRADANSNDIRANADNAVRVDNDDTQMTYAAVIDALICRTSCIPIRERASFNINVSSKNFADTNSFALQTQFARSLPMEFHVGAPVDHADFASHDNARAGLNIGLDFGAMSVSQDDEVDVEKIPLDDFADEDAHVWNYAPVERGRRDYDLLTSILFALLAGLAFNLTPCIFPVLSIRVLSFAQNAHERRGRIVMRSVAFGAGIVTVFLLLASLAAFAGLSWGEQFQNPYAIVAVIAMIVVLSLYMFNFFTIILPSAISGAEQKTKASLGGEYLKGVIATLLATPCGGPFLGALMAWVLLQKPGAVFAVFAAMGVGMAAPYVLLASSKRLMKLLPKPGRWVEDLKNIMGFLMLAFAMNLLAGLDARFVAMTVGICLSILCAASVCKRYAPFGATAKRRAVVMTIALVIVTAGTFLSNAYLRNGSAHTHPHIGVYVDDVVSDVVDDDCRNDNFSDDNYHDNSAVTWHTFTPSTLQDAHERGQNVIVNFTAAWCTNCKLNYSVALNSPAARELYETKNILLLTADITNHNPQAQSLLRHLGSRSIPFLAIFSADDPYNPVIKRDIISRRDFVRALQELP